jgi:hypothetical protein
MVVFSRNIIVNMPQALGNMRMFPPRFPSSSSTIGLAIKTTIALAIILLTSNVTTGFAQQQEQQVTSQPSATGSESLTRTAPSKEDSFRIQVPQGWVIQDVDNTGFALAVEILEGYGILAQLCPEGQEEQQLVQLLNASGNTSSDSANSGSICRETQEEVIHIVRYPNIGARLGLASDDLISNSNVAADIILAYQMQKLQEGGYRDIRIVDSMHTTVNIDLSTGLNNNNSIATTTVPAKLVEMTYSTNLSPDQTRRGYFLSTATDVTPPYLGTIKGYAVFYEGNSSSTNNTTTADSAEIITTSGDNSLSLAAIGQVFDSFELIAAPEVAQAIAQEAAEEGESLPVTNATATNATATNATATNATATNATATNATEINTESADIAGEGIDSDAGDADGTASALDTDAGDAADDEGGDAADDEGGDAADDNGGGDAADDNGGGDGDDATNAIDADAEGGDDNGGDAADDNGGDGDGTDTACDPSYPDDCIPSPPPDLDCGDDGIPENFKVLPPDPHEFDDDNDGIGCESESNQQSGLAEEPDSPGSNDSLSIVDIINWAIDGFPRL